MNSRQTTLILFRASISLILALVLSAAEGKIQCSCPKIPADGEGNSSCSTAEVNSRCSIDFNIFGLEAENRAASILAKAAGTPITIPPQGPSTVETLRTLRPEQVVDAVLVYLAVAAGNLVGRDSKYLNEAAFKALVDSVRKSSSSIGQAFDSSGAAKWVGISDEDLRQRPDYSVARDGFLLIAPGCVEASLPGNTWVMFKANWSPARVFPQCDKKR